MQSTVIAMTTYVDILRNANPRLEIYPWFFRSMVGDKGQLGIQIQEVQKMR